MMLMKPDDTDLDEMTKEVQKMLSVFEKVGIASRDRFEEAPSKLHPRGLMPDFQSIIAYAQGSNGDGQKRDMGGFHNLFGVLAAQDSVIKFLNSHGYKASLIKPHETSVSLPRIGEQAGLGEISPVNSLVIENHGLTGSLGAIITDAPLIPIQFSADVCTECMECMDVCPATDKPFLMNPEKCNNCGECVEVCPV